MTLIGATNLAKHEVCKSSTWRIWICAQQGKQHVYFWAVQISTRSYFCSHLAKRFLAIKLIMRLWILLTSPPCLIVLQQLISIWFLFDFFLAQDSLTADALWKNRNADVPNRSNTDLKNLRNKHCFDQLSKPPYFDKIILVVIDALGVDFIAKSEDGTQDRMPFVERALHQRKAMGFTAKAATPTVTMPRLKALVSGTIPSFIDLIYNLAGDVSKFNDDNLLSIAKQHNKSLVFYGDDTWLSLFDRNIFTRARETFSFFASDYTTVDTNVTEYALPETNLGQHTDWDILILHYLGLDHIGHAFGYNKGWLIDKKLVEMDSVIENIYNNMIKNNFKTLIVVCGDHGMSEEGNHGGGSNLEADTAMIFLPLNQDLHHTHVAELDEANILQIDLAVTLAILTRMPIPSSSKGVAIESLLHSLWSDDELRLACAGLDNVIELCTLMDPDHLNAVVEAHELKALTNLHMNSVQSFSSNYNYYFKLARKLQEKLLDSVARRSNQFLIVIALVGITFLNLIGLKKISQHLKINIAPKQERLTCLIMFTLPILMHGSTDFIESERTFWSIFSLGAVILSVISAESSQQSIKIKTERIHWSVFAPLKIIYSRILSTFPLIPTFVLSSGWNKLKGGGDNSVLKYYILPFISVLFLCNSIRKRSDLKKHKVQVISLIGISMMLSKLIEESPEYDDTQQVFYRALMQKLALFGVSIYTTINLISRPINQKDENPSRTIAKLASSWMCLAFLLIRRNNFFFLILNVILESSINTLAELSNMSHMLRVLLYLSFAQCAFYNQGNSNSFASIDIKPAFYGQTGFNMILSIPLVALATYSTQIYWYIKMFQRLHDVRSPEMTTNSPKSRHTLTLAKWVRSFVIIRNFLSLSYYMFVCLVLRNHLFIWSVISPKLIFHFVSNTILLIATLLISSIRIKDTNYSILFEQSKISSV